MIRTGLVLASLACAEAALAQGSAVPPKPPEGRYALDAASCRGKDFFATLTKDRLDLPVFSCVGLSFRQTRSSGGVTAWQVDGKRCQGEHAGTPGPKRFSLESSATNLRIFWPDGSRGAVFLKCNP
ncbi:MAG: hypothetical protein ACRDBL_05960 [Rhabdaerophilum sp.]